MKRVILFFILSCLISWPFGALMVKGSSGIPPIIPAFAYMCGPGVAGVIMAFIYHRGTVADVLGLKLKGTGQQWLWLGLSYLIGMAIIMAALCINLIGPEVSLQDPLTGTAKMMRDMGQNPEVLNTVPMMGAILIFQWVLLAPLLNIPLMLSEELGWRGYLWSHLRGHSRWGGFWKTSAMTGLLWGMWHIPIILVGHNYPEAPKIGAVVFVIFCLLYAPLYSLVREKTHSVWGPCVLHANTNGAAALSIVMLTNPPMLWKGVIGLGGFIAIAIGVMLVWRFYRSDTALDNQSVTPPA